MMEKLKADIKNRKRKILTNEQLIKILKLIIVYQKVKYKKKGKRLSISNKIVTSYEIVLQLKRKEHMCMVTVERKSDWPTDQSTDRPIDRPTDHHNDRLLTDWLQDVEWPTDGPSDRPTDRPTKRPTKRSMYRPSDRCTDQAIDVPTKQVDQSLGRSEVDRLLGRYIGWWSIGGWSLGRSLGWSLDFSVLLLPRTHVMRKLV